VRKSTMADPYAGELGEEELEGMGGDVHEGEEAAVADAQAVRQAA
jgi:hypothetical protein